MEKEEYFRRLYALEESSEEEEDTNKTREVIQKAKPPVSSSFTSSSETVQERRTQQLRTKKKVPALHRATSAPISCAVKETPPVPRKTSLLRYDISTPEISDSSIQKATPPEGDPVKPNPERSISTPNIGSVVMKNSTGIDSMLGKKKKRRDSSIKLVPESDRIFAGQTLFYIPPDDVAPVRRIRIAKARRFGATWTKEWIPSITHIVVDKTLTYTDVMKFLKPLMKADDLPSTVILVNEEYPIDCAEYVSLLDPKQRKYLVQGHAEGVKKAAAPSAILPASEKSPEPSSRKRKWDDLPEKQTPPRSQSESQRNLPTEESGSSPNVWLLRTDTEEGFLVQSPHQSMSPPAGKHVSRNIIDSADLGQQTSFSGFGDALDEVIKEETKYAHLPLDDDKDGDGESQVGNPDDSDESERDKSPIRAPKSKRKYQKKGTFNQESFSCMKGGTGVAVEGDPNHETILCLQEMADYYVRHKDEWRQKAYRTAIGVLKKQPTRIVTYDQAILLPHVGHSIATKIEEITTTKVLRKLEYMKLDQDDAILQTFLKVYDSGPSQSMRWIQAGYKTLDDLKTRAKLTINQRIGVEHYDDFNTRIPRQEVTALGDIVKKAVATIDSDVAAIIGGSYRRGAATSGDIDFILTKPGTTSSHQLMPFLSKLVDHLTSNGFLVAALAQPRSGEGSKWHGACVLPGNPIWRRIDFLVVPEAELGAALIYFTGDDIFNRSLRLLAGRKGMRLNQRGLYKDVLRGPGRDKISQGSLLEGADEKKIFEILKVPYRPPEQRICH